MCERVERRAPGVRVSREGFVAALAKRDAPATPDDDALLELFVAAGCIEPSETALAHFAAHYLPAATEAVAHMHLPRGLGDDVVQKTSEKLLVARDGKRASVLDYAGQGKLRGLIKVVAVRTALSELRKHKREVALPDAGPDIFAAPGTSDPELAFVKDEYRAEFKRAFEEAVEDLTDRERNLLRLHLLRGVTLEALSDIYSVHRSTVVRWLSRAREQLMTATRERLGARLKVSRAEVESVMAWIGSRLDASVSRVLATRAPAED